MTRDSDVISGRVTSHINLASRLARSNSAFAFQVVYGCRTAAVWSYVKDVRLYCWRTFRTVSTPMNVFIRQATIPATYRSTSGACLEARGIGDSRRLKPTLATPISKSTSAHNLMGNQGRLLTLAFCIGD